MLGVDILEVKRIEKALKKESFLKRVFTIDELEYAQKYKNVASHLTGYFCAKEAVMKALVNCEKISFLDIEIMHEQTGKPFAKLYNNALNIFNEKKYKNIEISISQTDNYAVGICKID